MTKIIVCLTGMPGAGKSTIAAGLKSRGFEVINMGDEIRLEAKRRKIEPTGKNLGKLMLELREKDGQGAVAELISPKIRHSSSKAVIIDGIRSNAEIEVLRKLGNVKILAIHASTQTRFDFLKDRGRSDDPKDKDTFTDRDSRELQVGISNSIALADETISNNNLSKEELIETAHQIINNWIS